MRAHALAAILLLAGPSSHAQPRPPYGPSVDGPQAQTPTPYDRDGLRHAPAVLYGLISAGVSAQPDHQPSRLRFPATAATPERGMSWGVDAVERSHLGFRTTEVLDAGWLAHLDVEQTLHADTGEIGGDLRGFGTARSSVGISKRQLGRADIGRLEQPASVLVSRIDPWRRSGAASPGWRLYAAPAAETRSPRTAMVATPGDLDLQLTVQVGRDIQSEQKDWSGGFSLVFDRAPWLMGLAGHSWADGSWSAPWAVRFDSGAWAVAGTVTEGRVDDTRYRNLFISGVWPVMQKGDPARREFRLGLNLHRVTAGARSDWTSDSKFSMGMRHHLSRSAWFSFAAAVVKPRSGKTRTLLEVGLSYRFERDLRWPQWTP